MGKEALSRESHQYLISTESAPPTKKARAFSQYEVVTGNSGWRAMDRILAPWISPYEKLLGRPLSQLWLYMYLHTSTNINLPFFKIIIPSYPFLFMQRHAYLLPPHIPRSWKS